MLKNRCGDMIIHTFIWQTHIRCIGRRQIYYIRLGQQIFRAAPQPPYQVHPFVKNSTFCNPIIISANLTPVFSHPRKRVLQNSKVQPPVKVNSYNLFSATQKEPDRHNRIMLGPNLEKCLHLHISTLLKYTPRHLNLCRNPGHGIGLQTAERFLNEPV